MHASFGEQVYVAILNKYILEFTPWQVYLTVRPLAVAERQHLQQSCLPPGGRVLRAEQSCVWAGKALVVKHRR